MTRTASASQRRFSWIAAAPLALVLTGCDALPGAACPAVGELEADLAWVREGGSAQCGGPMSTDPLVLPLIG